MVVCWDDLDAAAYARRLNGLDQWSTWFRRTYRIPTTVFAPCWYAHPGIREDLGHLWTGWLLTRHPDTGIGAVGLDWDGRREQTIARLREATAISGCTTGKHQPEQSMPSEYDVRIWDDHVTTEIRSRALRSSYRAAVAVVDDRLRSVELRHELAPGMLADIATEPASATLQEKEAVASRLRQVAEQAVAGIGAAAANGVEAIVDQQEMAVREARIADSRRAAAEATAAVAVYGAVADPSSAAQAAYKWLNAVEVLVPAMVAADRAAAAAAARSAAVDRRVAGLRRHPEVGALLKAPAGQPAIGSCAEGDAGIDPQA